MDIRSGNDPLRMSMFRQWAEKCATSDSDPTRPANPPEPGDGRASWA